MKRFLLLCLLLSDLDVLDALAQQRNEKIQSLLDAESAFAEMAKKKNTRDAFIHFFSDSTVTAAPGHGPRKGKTHLFQQSPNKSWLNWWPTLSYMAASGDFGFNTGPWEFRQQLSDEKPTAFGQFLSVWKKESSGEWKVALDMGISHGQPSKNLERRVSMARALSGGQDLFEIERQLVMDLNEKGWRAYNDFLASEARFLRTGSEPLTTKAEIERHLEDSSTGIYSFANGEVAPTQDLAFTYGSVLFAENSDPKNRQIKSYTRLWKRERDGWKIMVDLLSD